ncbi:hypothetical protein [Undibacterium sp.]|uniref:hypothetical protein n=1 Tax=Undibacterium sp. TaxID=1914977 RepID=UPI0025D51912|nr:hypothetical protein [Undibacterium sp.]
MPHQKPERRLIWLQPEAATKPQPGQACNACGVCCASEPCPVARAFLWQFRGACQALVWSAAKRQYRCGMLLEPSNYLRFLPRFAQKPFRFLVARWIAADTACDSDAQV